MVDTDGKLALVADRAPNVAHLFRDRVTAAAGREAFRFPDARDEWQSVTWREVAERVDCIAAGLVALGLEAGQGAAIASGTRYEWVLADLAILCAGATTTTIYPTTISEDVQYILADSGSRVVFAEDDEQVAKLREQRAGLPEVKKVVVFDGTPDGDWVIGLEELERMGEAHLAANPSAIDDRIAGITPDSIATLIYTSGTTGRPKGVRLSHDGWCYEARAARAAEIVSDDDLQFLWLPLAHAFGKLLIVLQLELGFATAIDGRVPKIVDNLAVVKPTFMGAAPRIFEKAHGRIVSMVEEEGGIKQKLFSWAFRVGIRASRLRRDGKALPLPLKLQLKLADKLVFSKVRERFGGRIRFFVSGAAPLSTEIAEWFHAAGMLILEGYGLTETSAGSTLNTLSAYKLGTVGRPVSGTELKIADDGEILIRNPGVMRGYHNLDAETQAMLAPDGWLATGDIGEIDADGFVRITDRKKDLFKTSGGKYVAPSHIEGLFKGICPLVSQFLVHGAQRKFVSALITLDPDSVQLWAEGRGMAGASYAEVVSSPEMRQKITADVEALNAKLNPWEQVKKFEILDRDLTIEDGEITPSLKLKRNVVERKYADVLDGFYD